MMRFQIYHEGNPAKDFSLEAAYLVGTDHVPVKAEFEFRNGELVCHKRAQGPGALVVLWPVRGFGRVLLETTRLVERDRPYNLHMELVRGQLLRLHQKREDWGLFDIDNIESIVRNLDGAQEIFLEAVKCGNVAKAARLSDDALSVAVPLGEQMALFHAAVFLNRRRQADQLGRRLFGCVVNPKIKTELYRRRLQNGFDFVSLPLRWRDLEPRQGEYCWEALDEWVEWCTSQRIPLKASPLVSFRENHLPDWIFIYENDYATLRELVYGYIQRVIERYSNAVQVWDVISGIHAWNTLNLNFEQIMEMTRMASTVTKQLAPRAAALVELVFPWGEYYSRNPRTIPPLLYADMIVQNGIPFDAIGLQLYVGANSDGMYVRDMFQISSMLDRLASFGKPVHVTAVETPSNITADPNDAWGGKCAPERAGLWYDKWSEPLQSRWLREFYNIALSKPFLDTITWGDLADLEEHVLPNGGLLRADLTPKLAYEQLCTIRAQLQGTVPGRAAPQNT